MVIARQPVQSEWYRAQLDILRLTVGTHVTSVGGFTASDFGKKLGGFLERTP